MQIGPAAWRTATALSICLMLAGCDTLRAYEGPHRPKSELARVSGDLRIRAGAPLSLILRRVDEFTLGIRYSAVDLLPGTHELLIDCTVTESGRITRHHLAVDLEAGAHYRLVADTGPGNRECVDVQIVAVSKL